MDWIKQNPFLAAVALASVLVAVAGSSLLFSEMVRSAEAQETFHQKSRQLEGLRRHKPFPNEANVEASEREAAEARQVLEGLAGIFSVKLPSASPQSFQDELAKLVKDTREKAAAKNVLLPEDFYLGFEKYEAQLPTPETAPRLTLQLRTVHAVVSQLLDAQVKAVGGIFRAPIEGESPVSGVQSDMEPGTKGRTDETQDFEIAPFDISFVSTQPAFRTAFNRLLDMQPPVFLRLIAVENSAPTPPLKKTPESTEGEEGVPAAPETGIRAVVGRETITVSLQLSSVISSGGNSP